MENEALFLSMGLSEQKVRETLKNKQVSGHLRTAALEAGAAAKEHGALLYHLASKTRPQLAQHIPLLTRYVAEGKLDNTQRVDGECSSILERW